MSPLPTSQRLAQRLDISQALLSERSSLADDVRDGLGRELKQLPPKHLYDARGCDLFEEICTLPEYYPTRTERAILTAEAARIVAATGASELVELGAGSATKTRVLLDAMAQAMSLARYIPFDIAEAAVRPTAEAIFAEYPQLDAVHGVVGDFFADLDLIPEPASDAPRLVALLGSTIGNFVGAERRELLREIRRLLRPQDHLLLGADLVKDPAVLEAAYNDSQGVTAAFDLNMLRVINRELDGDIPLANFSHRAHFDTEHEWIEMRLRAQSACHVRLDAIGLEVDFAAGEELLTEISAKFTPVRLAEDLGAAGLEIASVFTDPDDLFALALARPQASRTPRTSTGADRLGAALSETRERTLALVSPLGAEALEQVHSPLLSPLVWDLGHIAAFEDLWVSRTFGSEMVQPELIAVYDADETPRADRGRLPFLRTEAALDYLERTRANTLARLGARTPDNLEQRLELIIRHELQHNETMLQTLQIAGLPTGLAGAADITVSCDDDGLDLIPLAGGQLDIGSERGAGFSYDNEQPRRRIEVAAFQIGRFPVSNRAWADFIAAGGYRRRELWSAAGWAWRQAEDVQRPLYWTAEGTTTRFGAHRPTDPFEPVCHISHFEAEAFARFHEARLPTEFEWEAAATIEPRGPKQLLHGLQNSVWQWTASEFNPYPGFRADPYPEYSEQFFAQGYLVLRGGAWISSPRVATAQFRNWDHPQRRQIFSGLRLARDL
jgi:dimethylhistidine N-methyltransferase